MPSYGSLHSPSLRKMENSRYGGYNNGGGRKGISLGNIIGDPFALATISISAVSLHIHPEQKTALPPRLAWDSIFPPESP